MTENKEEAPKMLYWSDLKPLCASGSPCITITLPAFRHGEQAPPYATDLKDAVRTAQQVLLSQNLTEDAEGLLAPIRQLAEEPEMKAGGRDRVVFRSPDVFRWFDLPGRVPLRTAVGRYCHVLPLLNQLKVDREFYILELSEKHLRLLHYLDGECEVLRLPDTMPKSAEAAGAFDPPDHMLRDRSAAARRPRGASSPAVVFGTGSEREKAHERLQEFFRLVDQRLSTVLSGQPLLLSGVSYEVASYRRVAVYPHLMEGELEGDLHTLALPEIARRADEQARIQYRRNAEKELQQLRRERTSTDIHQILVRQKNSWVDLGSGSLPSE